MYHKLELMIQNDYVVANTAQGVEVLGHPFKFEVEGIARNLQDAKNWLGKNAKISIYRTQSEQDEKILSREFKGIVTSVHPMAFNCQGEFQTKIIIHSPLYQQRLCGGFRVFIDQSVDKISKLLVKEHEVTKEDLIFFDGSKQFNILPMCIQGYEESNFDFIHRLSQDAGLVLQEKIDLQSGFNQPLEAKMDNIKRRRVGVQAENGDYLDIITANSSYSGLRTGGPQKLSEETFYIYKMTHEFRVRESNVLNLSVNNVIRGGDYRNTIEGVQFQSGSLFEVMNKLKLLNLSQRTKKLTLPPVMIGAIESLGKYAHLELQSLYKLRLLGDLTEEKADQKTLRSDWLPRLQLFGGARTSTGKSLGLHLPLYEGAEVIVGLSNNGCTSSKPLIILGGLPNFKNTLPKSSSSLSINRLKTMGATEIQIKDDLNNQHILFKTNKGLALELKNAYQKYKIQLDSLQGQIFLKSHKNTYYLAKRNFEKTVGKDISEYCQESYENQTQYGNIETQAKNIKLETSQDTTLKANRILLRTKENQTTKAGKGHVNSKSQNIIFHVNHESLRLLSKNLKFYVKGGVIHFQEGVGKDNAGFKIDEHGNVTLFGKSIILDSQTISLSGNVCSQSEGAF